MIKSMTGFGSREKEITSLGKACVEIRSTNHKFLDIVLYLPEELAVLEDKIKKDIAGKIKRGRVTCVVSVIKKRIRSDFINKALLKSYAQSLKNIKRQLSLKSEVSLDTLIHLPGVLLTSANKKSAKKSWPQLRILVSKALDDLMRMRQKEGRALAVLLKKKAVFLQERVNKINKRFTTVIKEKIRGRDAEERAAFLKETDITEELERLSFHARNFSSRLSKDKTLGKELDFIAQEMQREANTMGAKSCDTRISAEVVQIKSQIEKIREQAQNIE